MALIWPSPGPPGLQFNSLDPRESGLDPVSANFRPKKYKKNGVVSGGLATQNLVKIVILISIFFLREQNPEKRLKIGENLGKFR